MILLQLSAAQGPAECCLAVSKALKVLLKEAEILKLRVHIIEQVPEPGTNTLKSVLMQVKGVNAIDFARQWHGTIQWCCESPYRPNHKRKNWFIGGIYSEQNKTSNELELSFETCRSSGPGGQHANKTDSAVRVVDKTTGLSVKVQSERSQHENKRLARLLIQHKLEHQMQQNRDAEKNNRHKSHQNIMRGQPIKIFKGEKFVQIT